MTVVALETRGNVAVVTLDRPEKLNAINDDVLHGLLGAVAAIGADEAIGAAVLTGRGRAFCAGGDIAAMDAMDDATFARTIALYMELATAVQACPKPFVAAVHGYALAGGFELALLCDVRFAARGTLFGLPDTPLGLSPTSGMTYLLPRVIGLGRAMYLTLMAENIDADEAERIGLVNRVTGPDDVLAEAEAFAHQIAAYPRVGVAWTKLGFLGSLDGGLVAATEREAAAELACFQSSDTREQFRGFLDRRRG